jgi:hypothetical protein
MEMLPINIFIVRSYFGFYVLIILWVQQTRRRKAHGEPVCSCPRVKGDDAIYGVHSIAA